MFVSVISSDGIIVHDICRQVSSSISRCHIKLDLSLFIIHCQVKSDLKVKRSRDLFSSLQKNSESTENLWKNLPKLLDISNHSKSLNQREMCKNSSHFVCALYQSSLQKKSKPIISTFIPLREAKHFSCIFIKAKRMLIVMNYQFLKFSWFPFAVNVSKNFRKHFPAHKRMLGNNWILHCWLLLALNAISELLNFIDFPCVHEYPQDLRHK